MDSVAPIPLILTVRLAEGKIRFYQIREIHRDGKLALIAAFLRSERYHDKAPLPISLTSERHLCGA